MIKIYRLEESKDLKINGKFIEFVYFDTPHCLKTYQEIINVENYKIFFEFADGGRTDYRSHKEIK